MSINWIESKNWELGFFGLPSRIPWPASVDAQVAEQTPFEMEHLLDAITAMGAEAGEPWTGFSKAAAHFDDLAELLEENEFVKASELLGEVENLHPGTSFVRFHRGFIARHEGRDDDALALYNEAADKTPNIAPIWNNIGLVHGANGRRDEAVAAFKKALALAPRDAVALEGLAQLKALVKILRDPKDQTSVAYVDLGTFRKMVTDQLNQLQSQPQQMMAMGEQLLRDGLIPDLGLQAMERAASLMPTDGRAQFALAAAYRASGLLEQSRALLEKLSEGLPDNPEVLMHLAQTRNAVGDTAGERAALEKVLELDPNNHTALGVFFQLGEGEHDPKKERTLVDFANARNAWMPMLLASSLARTRGDLKAAVAHAERAMELEPDGEEPLLHLTAMLGDARDVQRLATVVKPKLDSGKYSRRLDWNYAQVLNQLGMKKDAVAVLENALKDESAPEEFRHMASTVMDAWSGQLTGCGVQLEVHPTGYLLRPILLALEDGDGGVVLNSGTQLPDEANFPYRANGPEVILALQQGQSGGDMEPNILGFFRLAGIAKPTAGPAMVDVKLRAMPDGMLHLSASQQGRKLQVGWAPPRRPVEA